MVKFITILACLLITAVITIIVVLFVQEQQMLNELKRINSEITSKSYTDKELIRYLDSIEKTLEE